MVVQFIHLGIAIVVVSHSTVYVMALVFDGSSKPNAIKLVTKEMDSLFMVILNILKNIMQNTEFKL
jgi:hypothetical protein